MLQQQQQQQQQQQLGESQKKKKKKKNGNIPTNFLSSMAPSCRTLELFCLSLLAHHTTTIATASSANGSGRGGMSSLVSGSFEKVLLHMFDSTYAMTEDRNNSSNTGNQRNHHYHNGGGGSALRREQREYAMQIESAVNTVSYTLVQCHNNNNSNNNSNNSSNSGRSSLRSGSGRGAINVSSDGGGAVDVPRLVAACVSVAAASNNKEIGRSTIAAGFVLTLQLAMAYGDNDTRCC